MCNLVSRQITLTAALIRVKRITKSRLRKAKRAWWLIKMVRE